MKRCRTHNGDANTQVYSQSARNDLVTKYATVWYPGNSVGFLWFDGCTIRRLWGQGVMWACSLKSTVPLPRQLFNIAEIADDKSASWPLSVIMSVYRHANGPLGLGSPSFSLSCCLQRPHSPLDSSTWPQLLLSPPLPSTLPSPTDPLAESVGTICAGEVTFNLPGYYFLLNVFILNTKHRLTYTTLCLVLQCSCLDNSTLSSWKHAHPAGIAVRSGHKLNVLVFFKDEWRGKEIKIEFSPDMMHIDLWVVTAYINKDNHSK